MNQSNLDSNVMKNSFNEEFATENGEPSYESIE